MHVVSTNDAATNGPDLHEIKYNFYGASGCTHEGSFLRRTLHRSLTNEAGTVPFSLPGMERSSSFVYSFLGSL